MEPKLRSLLVHLQLLLSRNTWVRQFAALVLFLFRVVRAPYSEFSFVRIWGRLPVASIPQFVSEHFFRRQPRLIARTPSSAPLVSPKVPRYHWPLEWSIHALAPLSLPKISGPDADWLLRPRRPLGDNGFACRWAPLSRSLRRLRQPRVVHLLVFPPGPISFPPLLLLLLWPGFVLFIRRDLMSSCVRISCQLKLELVRLAEHRLGDDVVLLVVQGLLWSKLLLFWLRDAFLTDAQALRGGDAPRPVRASCGGLTHDALLVRNVLRVFLERLVLLRSVLKAAHFGFHVL